MMEHVTIFINSVHNYGNADEDCIDFSTDGLYGFDGETSCLSYMESAVTGMEGTRTSLKVLPDKIVVDRTGVITSRMVFCVGEKTSTLYETDYGSATLSVRTRRIDQSFNENGGDMTIDYVLDLEHAMVSRNRFQVKVIKQAETGENPNG